MRSSSPPAPAVRLVLRLLALGLASSAANAWAQPPPRARLLYVRGPGAEGCPDEQTVRREVGARLGYDPFQEPADMSVSAGVERASERLQAKVALQNAAGVTLGERRLASRSGDCVELASAMELAISIAIDPLSLTRPPPTSRPAPPPAPPPSPPREPSAPPAIWQAGLGALGSLGAAPAPALGLTAAVEARWPRYSLGLEGRLDLPASEPVASGAVQTSLLFTALVPCFRPGPFGVCALVAGGVEQGAGIGLVGARHLDVPYLAAGARGLVDLHLAGPLSLRIHADLLVPLTRTNLLVGDAEAWSTPPLAGAAGLAVVFRFL